MHFTSLYQQERRTQKQRITQKMKTTKDIKDSNRKVMIIKP